MKAKLLPKIGIRPTIDNRRLGVRESHEEQTMNMAIRTAEFLQQNLRQQQQTLQQLISNGVQLQRRIANDFLAAATGDGQLGGTTP